RRQDRRRPRNADARRWRLRRRHHPEAARRGARGGQRHHGADRQHGGSRMTQVLTHHNLLPTYARQDVTFVEGDGSWLVDSAGKRYLDLLGGIAVVGLGHRHPAPLRAAHEQLDRLWHTSNLYFTEPMQELASKLSDRFG